MGLVFDEDGEYIEGTSMYWRWEGSFGKLKVGKQAKYNDYLSRAETVFLIDENGRTGFQGRLVGPPTASNGDYLEYAVSDIFTEIVNELSYSFFSDVDVFIIFFEDGVSGTEFVEYLNRIRSGFEAESGG